MIRSSAAIHDALRGGDGSFAGELMPTVGATEP